MTNEKNEITIETTETKKTSIEMSKIISVYSGKANTCMCGCAGKYYYHPENKIIGTKNRGYEVTDDECSIGMVKKVLKIFENFEGTIENIEDYIFTIIKGERQYTIYLDEPKRNK